MKKSLFIIASMALIVTLAGCPGSTPNTTASPSPKPTATASPAPATTPTPASTATPGPTGPTATPTPLPSSQALPTPPPSINTGFSVTGATAVLQKDFSYIYTVTGTDFGAVGDYASLKAEVSGGTVELVVNGQARLNGDLKAVTITPTQITFHWVNPNSATSNDLLKLTYQKNNDTLKTSTAVRLSVQ